jgi:3-hydroxyacyl-CoA dehydrogenase
MKQIALAGFGLVGAGWAIAFARAGHRVAAWDAAPGALERGLELLSARLADLHAAGLIAEPLDQVRARIRAASSAEDALRDADHVQESITERLDAKRALYAELAPFLRRDAVLASSTSTFMPSELYGGLAVANRALVAHPVNPPDLVPLVEVAPSPATDPDCVPATLELMRAIGQRPILLNREVQGFVLNRLQWTLFAEACRLVRDGVASVDDVDAAMRDGLGRRWAFIGPFEVGDLNAPGGLRDYVERFGPMIEQIAASASERPLQFDAELIAKLDRGRRDALPFEALPERRRWRDRTLIARAAPPPSVARQD